MPCRYLYAFNECLIYVEYQHTILATYKLTNFRQITSTLILGFHMYKIWIKTILIGLLWELSELIHAEVMLSGQRMLAVPLV